MRAPLRNLGTTQGEMSRKWSNQAVTTSLLQWEKHVGGQIAAEEEEPSFERKRLQNIAIRMGMRGSRQNPLL
jgi:hypothetical protein